AGLVLCDLRYRSPARPRELGTRQVEPVPKASLAKSALDRRPVNRLRSRRIHLGFTQSVTSRLPTKRSTIHRKIPRWPLLGSNLDQHQSSWRDLQPSAALRRSLVPTPRSIGEEDCQALTYTCSCRLNELVVLGF